MMQDLVPFTRKVLALGVLVLVAAILISGAIVPLLSTLDHSLEQLADARFRHARLRALEALPPPPPGDRVPREIVIWAKSRQEAAQLISRRISAAANRNAVALEQAVLRPADAREVEISFDVVAAAPEASTLGMINELERSQPLIRLENWRLSQEGPTSPLRLEARLSGVWSTPR